MASMLISCFMSESCLLGSIFFLQKASLIVVKKQLK